MSGGRFNHSDRHIEYVADEIEEYIRLDFRYSERNWLTGEETTYDRIQCDTPEQRALIVTEAKALVVDLRAVAERCCNLDYLLSQDHGPETFLNNLKKP